MLYNVSINGKNVAIGLSNGELNQWLLDFDEGLDAEVKDYFRITLGCIEEEFEDFLYDNKIEPVKIELTNKTIEILDFEY